MDTLVSWLISPGSIGAITVVVALIAAVRFARHAWVAAQPDEWLLRIRDGKVRGGGVGVAAWRVPGDVIARFSSALQRVRFSVEAVSSEHLPVAVDGFILWSVSPDLQEAFRAFSKLGIVNLERPTPGLKSRAHLLTSPQHHAFQVLLAAEVRAFVSQLPLDLLLRDRLRLLEGLEGRLAALAETLGIVIERTEILQVLPADRALLKDLSARSEEGIRGEAALARLESGARQRRREAEDAREAAREDAESRLAKVEGDRQVAQREREVALERDLAAESSALTVQEARKRRDDAELGASLERLRRTAEAERDAALLRLAAEEQKSPAVREDERARFVTEQVTRAMSSWSIRDGRWIQVGDASPGEALARVVVGMHALLDGGKGPAS